MNLQVAATPLHFAQGAAWHLRTGLDHYRRLEVERGSTYGNGRIVEELERRASFELAWAAADLERVAATIDSIDSGLAQRLREARAMARDVADSLGARRYAPGPPRALELAARDASSAVELLQRG